MRILKHPYDRMTGGQWLRGNLHSHSINSDGKRTPQEVIDDYAARGYHFLMLSDHDIFTSETDYAKLDAKGLILIPGNEISANGPHMLHVHADRRIEPSARRQEVLNTAATNRGFVIVNHPNWKFDFNHCTIEKMREWVGYIGVEIYNGVIGRLDGSPYATNKWDMLLADGRQLWGFANDDSHWVDGDTELGWNMVYTQDRSVEAVIEAMIAGRFYASTGVTINRIDVKGTRIRIETKDAHRIVALQQVGKRFAMADDKVIEVDVPDSATYIRFECWGAGEKFAWTQPFFVKEIPDEVKA